MSSTWSGSITLGPDQVGVAYVEVDSLLQSSVSFHLSIDSPSLELDITWDGADFTHSGNVSDSVIGLELLNKGLSTHSCCEVWVKYVSDTVITSTATWSIVSGDGILGQSSLTIE